jgi:hypothetical protein
MSLPTVSSPVIWKCAWKELLADTTRNAPFKTTNGSLTVLITLSAKPSAFSADDNSTSVSGIKILFLYSNLLFLTYQHGLIAH